MSWTAPSGHVFVTGEIVTAATLNTYVRLNLDDLDRRTSPIGGVVATFQSTTSTSYTDLATVGPAVTVTIGSTGKALLAMHSAISNSASPVASYFGFAISGATTVAASDTTAIAFTSAVNFAGIRTGTTLLVTSLNPGTTTGTAKFRQDPSAGGANFTDRRLAITPLGS